MAILQRFRTAPRRYWLVALVVVFFLGFPTVVSSFQSAQWTQAIILAIASSVGEEFLFRGALEHVSPALAAA